MVVFLIIYVTLSLLIQITAFNLYDSKCILTAPKDKKKYYLLQFTWGLPMNVVGFICAAALSLYKRPRMEKWHWVFELPIDFGLNLGLVVIVPKQPARRIINHEIGHAIQNIYFGPFTIAIVAIPSVIRYWVRRWQSKCGQELPDYDSIWFEEQATKTGYCFVKLMEEQ